MCVTHTHIGNVLVIVAAGGGGVKDAASDKGSRGNGKKSAGKNTGKTHDGRRSNTLGTRRGRGRKSRDTQGLLDELSEAQEMKL